MIYPMMILYATVVLVAEAARKMHKALALQGRVRRLARI